MATRKLSRTKASAPKTPETGIDHMREPVTGGFRQHTAVDSAGSKVGLLQQGTEIPCTEITMKVV